MTFPTRAVLSSLAMYSLLVSGPVQAKSDLKASCAEHYFGYDFGVWTKIDDGSYDHQTGGIVLYLNQFDDSDQERNFPDCLPDNVPEDTKPAITVGINQVNLTPPASVQIQHYYDRETWRESKLYPMQDLFRRWKDQAREKPMTGAGYECLVSLADIPDEPKFYACFLDTPDARIDGLYVRCNKWDRCQADFGTPNALGFRVALPTRSAARMGSHDTVIAQEVDFWRTYTSDLMDWFDARSVL